MSCREQIVGKITSLDNKITSLDNITSKYKTLLNDIEIFEQERKSFLIEICEGLKIAKLEKDEEISEIYETIKVGLEGLQLPLQNTPKEKTEIQQSKEHKVPKKCRYHNRGFCKFTERCIFVHSTHICKEYTKIGICKMSNCESRHPKNCRYWCKRAEGCRRQNNCQYLHLESTRFKHNTINPEIFIEKETLKTTPDDSNVTNADCLRQPKVDSHHIETQHQDLCNECNDKNQCTICSLKSNVESKHELSTNACDTCQLSSTQQESLQSHIESSHVQTSSNHTGQWKTDYFSCNECKFVGNNKNELAIHTSAKHKVTERGNQSEKHTGPNQEKVECSLCTRLLKLGDTCVCKRLFKPVKQ